MNCCYHDKYPSSVTSLNIFQPGVSPPTSLGRTSWWSAPSPSPPKPASSRPWTSSALRCQTTPMASRRGRPIASRSIDLIYGLMSQGRAWPTFTFLTMLRYLEDAVEFWQTKSGGCGFIFRQGEMIFQQWKWKEETDFKLWCWVLGMELIVVGTPRVEKFTLDLNKPFAHPKTFKGRSKGLFYG